MFNDPLGKEHFLNMAEEWTATAAERLGVTGDTITAAIERGWTAGEIDAAGTAVELLVGPPARDIFGLKVVRG